MAQVKAHLFPFSVDKEGSVNTKQYFTFEKIEDEQYETIMLGRKLLGRLIVLNDKTQCQLFEKLPSDRYEDEQDQEMEEADQENTLESNPWTRTSKTIEEFILWKKDTAPSVQDARMSALDKWIDISEAIHEPVPLPKA